MLETTQTSTQGNSVAGSFVFSLLLFN